MGNIDNKLNYLNETKELIKEALNQLGAEIGNDDTFSSYINKIEILYNEYPNE